MAVSLDYNRFPCYFGEVLEWNNFGWVSILVLFFSTVHLILVVRYINEIGKRFKVLKKRYKYQYERHSMGLSLKQTKQENLSKLHVSKLISKICVDRKRRWLRYQRKMLPTISQKPWIT